jgi:YD repeat-containing protein
MERRRRFVIGAALAALLSLVPVVPTVVASGPLGTPDATAAGVSYSTDDLFAGTGSGTVLHYSSSGQPLDTLNPGASGEETGMCFDASGDLYTTNFTAGNMTKFDNQGNVVKVPYESFSGGNPESCVFDQSGNMLVGTVSSNELLEFSASGALLHTWTPAVDARGIDWIDLASDGCTLYYTSEGTRILRFNVCTGQQEADFATQLPSPLYALRIRPNGEVMVNSSSEVLRLNTQGQVIQTYPDSTLPGSGSLFGLNLDNDGTSFWTSDYGPDIYRVDIASGSVLHHINLGQQFEGLILVTPALGFSAVQSATGVGGGEVAVHEPSCAKGRPVNCASGDFYHTFTDAKVGGLGPGLELSRTYNSLNAAASGMFGYGWSSSYDSHLKVNADNSVTITAADGSAVTAEPNGAGGYTMPSWADSTLTVAGGVYAYVRHHTQTFTFTSTGQLTSIADRNGHNTTLSYNTAGQLAKVTDATGRSISVSFGANGLVSQVTDPLGQPTAYGYDTNGNLTSVTDPMNRVTKFTYDPNHLLLTMTDPRNGVTTNVYDASGRVTKQTDPAGLVTKWAYSGNNYSIAGGTTTITDPYSNVESQQYVSGALSSLTKGVGTSTPSTWNYTFDPATFGVASVKDPNGHLTTNTYDSDGNLLSTTDPLQQITTYTYNGLDEPLAVTDPMGIKTAYGYDGDGNLQSKMVTGNNGTTLETTTYTLCETAPPTTTTCTANGNTYAQGEMESLTDPAGHVVNYSYDAYGDVASVSTHPSTTSTDTTAATFDILGRRVCAASPKATAAGVVCPPAGQPRVADTTTYGYDADSELTSATDPAGNVTGYLYDGDGNQTQITDGSSNVTATTFDADNRILTTTRGAGSSAAGTTDNAYDLAPSSGGCPARPVVTYCTTVTDPAGRVSLSGFDAQDRLVTQN